MILGIVLGLYEQKFIQDISGQLGQGQKLALYLFDVGFILFCFSEKIEKAYKDKFLTRFFLYVGEISFGIYFTHVYFINLMEKFLPTAMRSWMFGWLMSIVLTVLFISIVKKLFPNISKTYLAYR